MHSFRFCLSALIVFVLVLLANLSQNRSFADQGVFTDVTAEAGISHTHSDSNDVTWMVGGVAVGDYDRDGWDDLYFPLLDGHDILYRNNGDGTFTDVSENAGFTIEFKSSGAAWGDIDNDGDLDLYVTTVQETRNYLFINDGKGQFHEQGLIRNAAVDSLVTRMGFGVAFGDYDRDGFLDILTSDWGNLTEDSQSRLLRNMGSSQPGYFEDVTETTGLNVFRSNRTWRFTPQFTDIDQNGHTDIAIVSDLTTSQLFWNNGDNTFTDGTLFSQVGTDDAGMGSAIADYDLDGQLDWFVTAIGPVAGPDYEIWTGNRMYRNFGDRQFFDFTELGNVLRCGWGWGTIPIDFDNDGDRDLAITNGWLVWPTFQNDPTFLMANDGGGVFEDVSVQTGLSDHGQGRGLVQLDYDKDGDLDMIVVNYSDRPVLYRNDGGNSNHWLRIDLSGTHSNRDGIGAIIKVTPDLSDQQNTLIWEVRSGDSYCSQSEMTAHFGLGTHSDPIDKIMIQWPSGVTQFLRDVEVDSRIKVVERTVLSRIKR